MNEVIAMLEKHGQHELASYLNQASLECRSGILRDLAKIDLDAFFEVVKEPSRLDNRAEGLCEAIASPILSIREVRQEIYRQRGESALKNGELAFFVVAGGQGSRLGFEHPKGLFPASPVSGRSLFQIHMEKVAAFSRMYGFTPCFVVMTSPGNHAETEEFIRANNAFGVGFQNVFLFSQGELPAVDSHGKLILAQPGSLFLAPDGHGGSLSALVRSGVLDLLAQKGVRYLSYFQVDNPMVAVCDASFLGVHITHAAEVSTKVIAKRDALEKLGNPMTRRGRSFIVEYSDLPETIARKTLPSGELAHAYGSIGIHMFNLDFVRRVGSGDLRLPFHRAQKKIPCFHFGEREKGQSFSQESGFTDGTKFEQFVFDAIPLAERTVFVETTRHEEFSPLKNKTGEDSIETCAQMQSEFFKGWLSRAGLDTSFVKRCEIAPSFACTESEFLEKVVGKQIVLSEDVFME
jgi:UDP-N-acetylglucosamine/UDP-N-acetylgalactosamine diphosphorylase